MTAKELLGQVWLLLSAFGICFAALSSVQELARGEVFKALGAAVLGTIVYANIGRQKQE